MNRTSVYYKNPTRNLFKFSPHVMYPRHSQTVTMDATTILFIEFLNFQLHYDPMFGSLYMIGTGRFRFYFFFHRDFAVPLFHPLFNLTTPYIAIALHVAHPASPLAAHVATPPTSPPQIIPSFSLDDDSDPSEAAGSSFPHPLVPVLTTPSQSLAWQMGSYLRNPCRGVLHLDDSSV